MKKVIAIAVVLFAFTLRCSAQFGAYAGFTTAKLDLANTPRINGGTFGALYDSSHFAVANLGADLRVAVLTSSNTTRTTSVTAGPRLALHVPRTRLRPYAELLIGEGHVTAGQGFASYDAGGLDATAAAGVDLGVLPHLDWRILDYSFSRLNGAHTYEHSFTTALVFRFR